MAWKAKGQEAPKEEVRPSFQVEAVQHVRMTIPNAIRSSIVSDRDIPFVKSFTPAEARELASALWVAAGKIVPVGAAGQP